MKRVHTLDKNKKNKLFKIWSIFLICFCLLFGIAATTGCYYVASRNYEISSAFDEGVNIRYELDLNKNENPFESDKNNNDDNLVKEKLNQNADHYAKHLNDLGVEIFNVNYEFLKEGSNKKGFINLTVPNEFYKKDGKKLSKSLQEMYFKYAYADHISFFFHTGKAYKKNPQSAPYLKYEGNYMFSLSDLLQDGNGVKLEYRENEIRFQINRENRRLDNIYKIFEFSKEDKKPDELTDDNPKYLDDYPYMYVFNNYNGLINKINYALELKLIAKSNQTPWNEYIEEEKRTNGGQSSIEKFVNDWFDHKDRNGWSEESLSTTTVNNPDYLFGYTEDKGAKLLKGGNLLIDGAKSDYNMIDVINNEMHTGVAKYNFLSDYMIGVVTNNRPEKKDDKKDEVEPTWESFQKWIPLKDPYTKKDVFEEKKWIVIPGNNPWIKSSFKLNQLKKTFNNIENKYSIKLLNKTHDVNDFELVSGYETGGNKTRKQINMHLVKDRLANNIFDNKAFVSVLISALLLTLALGIIVSILYKIPGALAASGTWLTSALTMLIMISNGFSISISLLLGFVIINVLGVISAISLYERYKKYIYMKNNTFIATKKALAFSFVPCLDLHAVILLTGVALSYFSSLTGNILGTTLVIGSLFSFIINVGLLFIILAGLFINQFNVKQTNWISWMNKDKLKNFMNEKSEEQIGIYQQYNLFKPLKEFKIKNKTINLRNFNIFNLKQYFIWLIIVIAFVSMLVVSLQMGNKLNPIFQNATQITLWFNDLGDKKEEVINQVLTLLNANGQWSFEYAGTSFNESITYLVFSAIGDFAFSDIKNIINSTYIPTYVLNSLSLSTLNSSAVISFALNDVNALLIATGFIMLYCFARFGWVSLIPLFVSLTIIPTLTTLFVFVSGVPFNSFMNSIIMCFYAINLIFMINMTSNIYNKYVRYNSLNWSVLKIEINNALKQSMGMYLIIYLITFVSLILGMIVISKDLLSTQSIILIGLCFSLIGMYFILPNLLAYMIYIKNKYTRNISFQFGTRINYDQIDEQLIDGINHSEKQQKEIY